jgi:hypothetical protein
MVLSGVVDHAEFPDEDCGAGFFLHSNYTMKNSFLIEQDSLRLNLHEFNVLPGGKSTLVTTKAPLEVSAAPLGLTGTIWMETNGFKEMDSATGRVIFSWSAEHHVGIDESNYKLKNDTGAPDRDVYHRGHVWDAL